MYNSVILLGRKENKNKQTKTSKNQPTNQKTTKTPKQINKQKPTTKKKKKQPQEMILYETL